MKPLHDSRVRRIALILFICCNVVKSTSVRMVSSEASVLLGFKSNVYTKSLFSSWNLKNDCTKWLGVRCNSKGNVISLYLSMKRVPTALGTFSEPNIRGYTAVGGPLPSSFSKLTRLRSLVLSDIQLVGEIPASIGNLTNLERLVLSDNRLDGQLPSSFSRLKKLVVLDVGCFYLPEDRKRHFLGGDVPQGLSALTNLQYLDLSYGLFTNLPSLRKLTKLKRLILTNNRFEGNLNSLLPKTNTIIALEVGKNSFGGSLPAVNSYTSLQKLLVQDTLFTGEVPMRNLLNLTQLDISFSPFSSVPSLQKMSKLTFLKIEANSKLTGVIPKLPAPSALQTLIILNTGFVGGFQNVFGHSNLVKLQVDQNPKLRGTISASLGSMKKLKHLSVTKTAVSGSIPASIGQLSSLTYLALSDNKLTGPIPTSMCNLNKIKELHIIRNALSGPIPNCWGKFKALTSLFLSYNQLTGPFPTSFCKLKLLSDLKLHYNKLSGPIPGCIVELKSLDYLYLSNNILSGPLPRFYPDFSPSIVDISNNDLSGTLPGWLNAVTFSLNVGHNRLNGTLPDWLGDLTYELNVAENLFKGPLKLNFPSNFKLGDFSGNFLSGVPQVTRNGVSFCPSGRWYEGVRLLKNCFVFPTGECEEKQRPDFQCT